MNSKQKTRHQKPSKIACITKVINNSEIHNNIIATVQGPQLHRSTANFIIDIGSSVNLIKLDAVHRKARGNKTYLLEVTGIGDRIVKTVAKMQFIFNNTDYIFHVQVPNSFSIKEDGILGTDFIKKELALTFQAPVNQIMSVTNNKETLKQSQRITIPARTSQVIPVKVQNPEVSIGLNEKIDLGHKVYFGNALVINRNGLAYAKIVNSNESPITIPQLEVSLEAVEIAEANEHANINNLNKIERANVQNNKQIIKSI